MPGFAQSAWLGDPYIAVNIVAQHLQLAQDRTIPLVSRVIVGQPSTPTPVLSSRVTEVVFNPPWNVPASITVHEILPELRRNGTYLLEQDMIVVGRDPDPHGLTIDWASDTGAGRDQTEIASGRRQCARADQV